MELRNIGYFLAVAAMRRLTPAAARLRVTPLALSHGIERLKSPIGAFPFARAAKRQTAFIENMINRLGASRDMAPAAFFLLERKSSFIAGYALHPCGGAGGTGTGGEGCPSVR